MRESLLTIPINEVFEPRDGCPICRMRSMLEKRTVEYIMGAAMMEPDVRTETNRLGFCNEHFHQMLEQKNRLSLALMLQSHLDETAKTLLAPKKLLESKTAKAKKLCDLNSSCFVCSKVDWGMERLLRTFFELFEKREFRELFNEQEYICLPHYQLLTELAPTVMLKQNLPEFNKCCRALVQKQLDVLRADIGKFCSMYDYRSAGGDFGSSRDSIERSVLFLTGRE